MLDENLEWLVDRRSRIQNLLLSLLKLTDDRKGVLIADHPPGDVNSVHQDLFALYVGAAFSLWRAVFLSKDDRTRRGIQIHAKAILKILVEENAVGLTQDKSTKEWMGGYYLNNAWFRLEEAQEILKKNNIIADSEVGFLFAELNQAESEEKPFREVWDLANERLEELFHLLRHQMQR